MRRQDLTHSFERDPLLKVGAVAMILALVFAVVVVVATSLDRPMEPAIAKSEVKSATEPLVRSDPGVEPWVERDIPPPKPEVIPRPTPPPEPPSTPKPDRQPDPGSADAPEQPLPLEDDDYPLPTNQQLQNIDQPRHFRLPPGAIMSLTIKSLGLKNAPVLNSEKTGALDKGVVHLPDTSFPWSDTPERNVYLAGHRLGWPGTGSHLVFYHLNQLDDGERITLTDRQGNRYEYRVIDRFTVGPKESWVTGRVEGRDLLTLQTCTPIPTFEKRLIVRAERI